MGYADCKDIFPFHNINNIDFRFTNTNQNMDEKLLKIYEKCTKLNFEPFDISNYNYCDFENEIDPNNSLHEYVVFTIDQPSYTVYVGDGPVDQIR